LGFRLAQPGKLRFGATPPCTKLAQPEPSIVESADTGGASRYPFSLCQSLELRSNACPFGGACRKFIDTLQLFRVPLVRFSFSPEPCSAGGTSRSHRFGTSTRYATKDATDRTRIPLPFGNFFRRRTFKGTDPRFKRRQLRRFGWDTSTDATSDGPDCARYDSTSHWWSRTATRQQRPHRRSLCTELGNV
jgi:hypothetical protein